MAALRQDAARLRATAPAALASLPAASPVPVWNVSIDHGRHGHGHRVSSPVPPSVVLAASCDTPAMPARHCAEQEARIARGTTHTHQQSAGLVSTHRSCVDGVLGVGCVGSIRSLAYPSSSSSGSGRTEGKGFPNSVAVNDSYSCTLQLSGTVDSYRYTLHTPWAHYSQTVHAKPTR